MEAGDTLKTQLKAGYYLCKEVPEGYHAHGFADTQTGRYYLLSKKNFMAASHIDTVFLNFDQSSGFPVLNIKFDDAGAKALLNFTKKWKGSTIGLLLQNRFIYVAVIASPISDGVMALTGSFTVRELNDLAKAIKSLKR